MVALAGTYHEEGGFSFRQSSLCWALYEWAAVPGTIACGWMSDRVFRGHRAPATILFMAFTLVAVVVYRLNRHGLLWIDHAALAYALALELTILPAPSRRRQ